MKQYEVKSGIKIPKRYHDYPEGHSRETWTGKDGKETLITELDDFHLINIYKWLAKCLSYYRDLAIHDKEIIKGIINFVSIHNKIVMSDNIISTLQYCMHYIAYEIHTRNLYISRK